MSSSGHAFLRSSSTHRPAVPPLLYLQTVPSSLRRHLSWTNPDTTAYNPAYTSAVPRNTHYMKQWLPPRLPLLQNAPRRWVPSGRNNPSPFRIPLPLTRSDNPHNPPSYPRFQAFPSGRRQIRSTRTFLPPLPALFPLRRHLTPPRTMYRNHSFHLRHSPRQRRRHDSRAPGHNNPRHNSCSRNWWTPEASTHLPYFCYSAYIPGWSYRPSPQKRCIHCSESLQSTTGSRPRYRSAHPYFLH